jgi:hypothetical protein
MIITAPTGLYKSILPGETEVGNITYTISTQSPPKTLVNAIQLPFAESITPAPDKIFDEETRREQFGNLIFSVSQSNKNIAGSNTKAFEVGEILSFENLSPVEEIVTVKAPEDVEIRHDTNLLDLESLGLTTEEIDELTTKSAARQLMLEGDFVVKQNEIKTLEADISETQKTINENNKTLKAVRGLLGIEDNETSDDPIFQKLSRNQEVLQETLDQLIEDRNQAAVEAADIYQDLQRVSELVR